MTNVNTQQIKVLRIINRFNVGGPVYNVTYLSKYLPDNYETKLVGGCATESEYDACYILRHHGISAEILPSMSRKISLLGDIRTLFQLMRIIKTFKPDIVHTHASKAGILGRIAARLMRVPVIVHTYHGHVFHGYFHPTINRMVVFIERLLGKFSTMIITISPAQHAEIIDKYRIVPSKKACIIPLGFDLSRFEASKVNRESIRLEYNLKPHQTAVAIVGRLAPIKNHHLFIDAAAQTHKKYPEDFMFYIVGDGKLRESLEAYVADNHPGLVNSIVFKSWVTDMTECYPAMDIVCLTSFNEGTPVSLIEAQASSIPVISTNVGGVKDIIDVNQTGFILQGHSSEELSKYLVELHLNRDLRIKMSQNACNFVTEKFSYQRLVADVHQLYTSLLVNE
jgi:glycosyltransferase involved in cell wall biosynthesis